jgi:hypothetical protein
VTLTREDRERINDSRLKIQSIANTLNAMNPDKIPEYRDIQNCLENAEDSLNHALRESSAEPKLPSE